ncbi:hypothetical protein GCM10025857_39940 [Alicyclobacillus contaminans]|nr:hypothetical protein GCM10025857_39940 [Alicyclobacillus contaminans]
MSIVGATIKELMDRRGITAYRLAKDTGVSYTGVSKILNGSTKNPQIDVLSTIADYFGVSVDYLLGQSIGALIESRMKEIDMSWDELSKKTGITLDKLKDLDQLQPEPWDYEPNGLIDRLATALEMDRKVLASAYTRQEPRVMTDHGKALRRLSGRHSTTSPRKTNTTSPVTSKGSWSLWKATAPLPLTGNR